MRYGLLSLVLAVLIAGGPEAQSWTRLTGRLEAGTPVALVHSARSGRLWVSTGEALYSAPTVGAAWSLIASLPFRTAALALALEGTTEALLVSTPYGLWRSTDEGTTWAQVHPALTDRGTQLRVHPAYPHVVLGIRGQMLWRSTDAGATWQQLSLPPGILYDACPFGALNDLLAWTSQGAFRSSDGGASWEALSTPFSPQPVRSLAVTAGVEPQLCLLLPDGVYWSTDGVNWRATTLPGSLPRALFASVNAIAAIAPGGLLVLRADGTWQTVYSGYTDHITVLLPLGPDRILVGSEGRGIELYRWTPQPQWQALRTGMDAPPIRWLLSPGSQLVVAGPSGIFWSSTDLFGLDNISLALPTPGTITAVAASSDGIVVATSRGLYRYVRSTGQWQTLTESLPAVGTIIAIGVTPGGDTLLLSSDLGELLRSLDGGVTWEELSPSFRFGQLRAVRHTFYAFGEDGIFRSTDAGQHWEALTSYPGRGCYRLLIHPADERVLLASSALPGSRSGKLYRSTDGGQSWQELPAADLLNRGLSTIAGGAPSIWYAGTLEGEVFRSTDGGLTWHSLGIVGDGLPVEALLEFGSLVLAGTSRGLWWQQQVSVSAESSSPLVQLRRGESELVLGAPDGTPLSAELYDLLGRCLGRWAALPPLCQIRIPTLGMASGIYVLRVRTGNLREHFVLSLP